MPPERVPTHFLRVKSDDQPVYFSTKESLTIRLLNVATKTIGAIIDGRLRQFSDRGMTKVSASTISTVRISTSNVCL